MKHVKEIYRLADALIVVVTASGVWTSHIRSYPGRNINCLRWTHQNKIWYDHYSSMLVDTPRLPPLYIVLLAKYSWMFVSPLSWIKAGAHRHVDMPI